MQTGKVGKSESAPVCLHTLSPHNMTPTNEIYCCDLFPWQPAARTSVYLKKPMEALPRLPIGVMGTLMAAGCLYLQTTRALSLSGCVSV